MSTKNTTDANSSSIGAIKSSIAQSFEEADLSVKVRSTEYFNNSYSPDLILSWPNEIEERHVFLRTNSNPAYLLEDVHIVGAEHAILLPISDSRLTDSSHDSLPEANLLQTESAKSKVLIAPASSIHAFGTEKSASAYSGLISRAVFQGGSGLLQETRAEKVIHEISTGFEHASLTDPSDIGDAVAAAESLLDTPRTNSITSFLQAMWLASGGTSDSFPVPVAAVPHLTTSALGFLLAMDGLEDSEFWNRMSVNVNMEDLLATGMTGSPINLQRLMRPAANRLRARVCRVLASIPEAASTDHSAPWFLGEGALGLSTNGSAVLFTNARVADLPIEGVATYPTIDDVAKRATESETSVLAMGISSGDSRVNFESAAGIDIASDNKLAEVASALGEKAIVDTAVVSVGASGRKLTCKFASSTGHGQSNAKFDLSEMALHALPLLLSYSNDELAKIQDLFADGEDADDSPGPQLKPQV